jgi:hypothetical protein
MIFDASLLPGISSMPTHPTVVQAICEGSPREMGSAQGAAVDRRVEADLLRSSGYSKRLHEGRDLAGVITYLGRDELNRRKRRLELVGPKLESLRLARPSEDQP